MKRGNINKKVAITSLIIITVLLAVTCTYIVKTQPALSGRSTNKTFEEFCNDIFIELATDDSISLNYLIKSPENYGINTDPASIGDISMDSFSESYEYADKTLKALSNYNYNELSESEKNVYDTIKWNFELEKKFKGYELYHEYINPTTGIHCQLPILLSEYRFYNEKSIQNYLAMLPDVNDYFKSIISFEELKSANNLFMTTSMADEIINQCNDFINNTDNNVLITAFNDKLNNMTDIDEQSKENYKSQNSDIVINKIIPAYKLLSASIQKLKETSSADGALCTYPKGSQYYELLVKANTGSSRSIKDTISMLDKVITSDQTSMFEIIAANPDIVERYQNANYGSNDADTIISSVKSKMDTDFPTINDTSCTIKFVPSSLENYMSPAFYLLSPIDDYKSNTVYINNSSKYTGTPLFTSLTHEAYPGHLYQNAYFCSTNKYPVLNVLCNKGYQEGWASYVTIFSYAYSDMDNSLAQLAGYNNSLVLCLSARTDIGIHYENWSTDDIKNYFTKNNCSLNDEAVNDLYNIIISDPGNYLTYAIGYIDICLMRENAKKKLGNNFSIKDYHTFILDCGPVPFDCIENKFDSYIETER